MIAAGEGIGRGMADERTGLRRAVKEKKVAARESIAIDLTGDNVCSSADVKN